MDNTQTPFFDYEQQIQAQEEGVTAEIREDRSAARSALERYCDAAAIGRDVLESMSGALAAGAPFLKTVWAETGACPGSLFAFLPGCQHCLTQAKSAYGMGAESDWFADQLALMGNPLIPTAPERICVDMLPEFARLQTEARRLVG